MEEIKGPRGTGIGNVIDETIEIFSKNYSVFLKYVSFWAGAVIVQSAAYYLIPLFKDPAFRMSEAYPKIRIYIDIFLFIMFLLTVLTSMKAGQNIVAGKKDRFPDTLLFVLKNLHVILPVFFVCAAISSAGMMAVTRQYLLYQLMPPSIVPPAVFAAAILIPLIYICARYLMALPCVIDKGVSARPFRNAEGLASGNYSLLISAVILLGLVYKLTGDMRTFYFPGDIRQMLLAFIMVPFGTIMMAVIYARIESPESRVISGQKISGAGLAGTVILSVLLSPIILYLAYPDLPEKVMDASENLMGFFSEKIVYPGNVELKRPSGWRIRGTGRTYDSMATYYISNPKIKALNGGEISGKDLAGIVFTKGFKDDKRKEKIEKVLYPDLLDNSAMCAYNVKVNLEEKQASGEYPKGLMRVEMKQTTKESSTTMYQTFVYRVVKNRYVITGHYEFSDYTYEAEDEESRKEAEKRRLDAAEEDKIFISALSGMILE